MMKTTENKPAPKKITVAMANIFFKKFMQKNKKIMDKLAKM
ncbi:MAG: hypothetical protein PHN56_00440 [Candidatus Nanoarchaeia archaeon]|nr:hypothetical protein [Candidatus Nanoarchaeia archaeon]